jgi:hypothetical protein
MLLVVGLLGLAIAAYAPYLGTGFFGDDFIFLSALEGATPYDPWKGLWGGDLHDYPGIDGLWWADPEAQGAFLRPVASWAFAGLYAAFGRWAVPYHLVLAFLHGLVAATGCLLMWRLSGRMAAALGGAVLFLIAEDHAMTVAWITTITDLQCALLLNLALLCHVLSRHARRRWLYGVSLIAFLLALGSKETAVVYPAIILSYELVFADAPAGAMTLWPRMRAALERWWSWVIPAAMVLSYLVLYRAMIPAMRNLMYVEPFSQPAAYLTAILTNLPVMVTALVTPVLPSLTVLVPGMKPFVVAGGAIVLAVTVPALWPSRREPSVLFAVLAFTLTLLPGLAAAAGERLLYLPSLYGFFLVSWLILQLPPLRRRLIPKAPVGLPVIRWALGLFLVVTTLALPLVLLFLNPGFLIPGMKLPERTLRSALPHIDPTVHRHVVFLTTGSSFNTLYLADIYRYYRGEFIDLRLLSSFNGRVWARRVSERTLELRTADDGWLGNLFAALVRVSPILTPGTTYRNQLFTVTVEETTASGRDLRRARFDFTRPLDDPSLLLLCHDGRRIDPCRLSDAWRLVNPSIDRWAL